jgi:hypothetical protein
MKRISLLFVLVFALISLVQAQTQTMSHPSTGTLGQTTTSPTAKSAQTHAAAEHNPACQRIINECKKLGFIQGQWKEDNGLWKDCFDPVVKGSGNATRDGKPISVPVSSSDLQACRASEGHHKTLQ